MNINKDLVAASATPLILAILAESDSYGYAILKRVSDLSSGQLQWTDGMLYPVLHRLERQGQIEGRWGASESGRRRKYYRITRRGQSLLAEQREQWRVVDATLQNAWLIEQPGAVLRGRFSPPSLLRAMARPWSEASLLLPQRG